MNWLTLSRTVEFNVLFLIEAAVALVVSYYFSYHKIEEGIN